MDKDRDLPITNYLDILQKEYVVAEIRHKIYPKISDKKYWKKVMNGKKKKVEDICFRNKIGSIFTEQEEKERIYLEIYPEKGVPNFSYINNDQKLGNGDFPGLEETDYIYYYSEGAKVRVDHSERKFGTIIRSQLSKSVVFVEIEGVEYKCECSIVTRIL
jgi:hypothetical protein